MSHYLFGLRLDGAFPPKEHQGLQVCICGPATLLSALETSMGLPTLEAHPLRLTLAYRDLITTTLTDGLFHEPSFRCDPLATTRLLLSWREALTEAGWHGDIPHENAPIRLQILADLESGLLTTGLAATTHAGRIAAILAELESGSQPAITSLTVLDPLEILPRCWIKLFDALNASYDDPTPFSVLAEPSSTLSSVQAHLLGQNPLIPDDRKSVRIITASTPEAAADALACQIASLDPASVALIADPSERETLNCHLQRLDLPLPTSRQETAAALLELPSLVIRCRLAPFNPQAWIQVLLHSPSPIPSRLRRRLAESINTLPGHGPHWDEVLESCISQAKDEEEADRLRQAYADWVKAPLIPSDALAGPTIADAIGDLPARSIRRRRSVVDPFPAPIPKHDASTNFFRCGGKTAHEATLPDPPPLRGQPLQVRSKPGHSFAVLGA